MEKDQLELFKECYNDFVINKNIHKKAKNYYKGKTDAMRDYKMITSRSNSKCRVNYIKKFVKEEVSYCVGNPINYISKNGDKSIVDDIDYYITSSWDNDHDAKCMKEMILHGLAFEIYYLDNNLNFKSKTVNPCNGYVHEDDKGNVIFFMHIFTKKFDKNIYVDVYTKDCIYHYDSTFSKEITTATPHIFGRVPVGVARISDEEIYDTIFNDIKGLQDAYETNLSDISNEISDFRNAYLKIIGAQLSMEDTEKMKESGILQMTEDGKIEWLIKSINDTFIQNTLSTIEDKMYQLTSHINHNEAMQSNLSGVALRSRLISLEQKCILNQKAYANLVKTRLKMLFIFLKIKFNKNYDYRDIKIKFTPNIPQDDQATAQIISQLGDKLSLETGLSLLSFITNPSNEVEKVKAEQNEVFEGTKLLDGDIDE